jgi:energy-coupling factor transporter transmembrane protein EcfT
MIIGWLFFLNEVKAFRKNKNLETLLIFAALLLFFLQFPKPEGFIFLIWSVFLYFVVTAFYKKTLRGKSELWFKVLSYFLLFIILFFGYAYLRVVSMAKPAKFFLWKSYYGTESEVWRWVDENSQKEKRTIAYVGNLFLYPLFGSNLQNTVYYQPVNSINEKLIHQYHFDGVVRFPSEMEKLEDIYRKMPDYAVWREGLKSHGTNWILIRKETGKNRIEEEWISKNPENFSLIFENDFAKIYTLKFQY